MIDWGKLVTAEEKADQVKKEAREAFKSDRAAAVSSITVTTSSGNTFDGDEVSQERMARAIVAMPDEGAVRWVLADNTTTQASAIELKEALRLAGAAQASIWVMDNSKDTCL